MEILIKKDEIKIDKDKIKIIKDDKCFVIELYVLSDVMREDIMSELWKEAKEKYIK